MNTPQIRKSITPSHRILLISVGLFLVLGLIIWIGDKTGGPAPHFLPKDPQNVGAWGPVSLVFPVDVDPKSAQQAIRILPETPGHFSWQGRTMLYWPEKPFQDGQQYELRLGSGFFRQDGIVVRNSYDWKFRIRPIRVIYLARATGVQSGELEILSLAGSPRPEKLTLTKTGGKVIDFSTTRDGNQVIFSVLNEKGGADVWRVDRSGENQALVLACGMDRCDQPSWSPDAAWIAVRRMQQKAPLDAAGQIEILGPIQGVKMPAADGMNMHGLDPEWAPVGSKLAFLDSDSKSIQVIDFDQNHRIVLPVQSGVMGSWSPTGKQFLYADLQQADVTVATNLFSADLSRGQVNPIPLQQKDLIDFSGPSMSPDGTEIAVGAHQVDGPIGRQLWFIHAENGKIQELTEDTQYSFSAFAWSPTGAMMIMQRYPLGSSDAVPEIVLWQAGISSLKTLAQNAVEPEWLP
jgi:dipeptidyl aminopeptidase/acylaminoacyl peptidase